MGSPYVYIRAGNFDGCNMNRQTAKLTCNFPPNFPAIWYYTQSQPCTTTLAILNFSCKIGEWVISNFIDDLWLTNLNSLINCKGKSWDALESRLTCFSSLGIVIDKRCDQPTRTLDFDLRLWTDWLDQLVVDGVAAQSNNTMATHGAVT